MKKWRTWRQMELERKSNQLEGLGVVHAGTWLDSPDLDGVLRVCRTLLLRILMNARECVHANVRLCMGFIGEASFVYRRCRLVRGKHICM